MRIVKMTAIIIVAVSLALFTAALLNAIINPSPDQATADRVINALICVLCFYGIFRLNKSFNKLRRKTGSPPAKDAFDPETGEVYGYDTAKSGFMDRWEDGLQVLWEGEEQIAFSYESNDGRKSRRTLTLYRVLRNQNNAIYFRGLCHLRSEERTFADAGITSKITHNGKRYDWEDFVEQRLGVKLDS